MSGFCRNWRSSSIILVTSGNLCIWSNVSVEGKARASRQLPKRRAARESGKAIGLFSVDGRQIRLSSSRCSPQLSTTDCFQLTGEIGLRRCRRRGARDDRGPSTERRRLGRTDVQRDRRCPYRRGAVADPRLALWLCAIKWCGEDGTLKQPRLPLPTSGRRSREMIALEFPFTDWHGLPARLAPLDTAAFRRSSGRGRGSSADTCRALSDAVTPGTCLYGRRRRSRWRRGPV